jgi:pyruvate ferredoxin oxidoreductase alpha subunit
MAYKIAEQLKLPVMVNVDGFIMTHIYEPVSIPEEKLIKKYLPNYKPTSGEYLDVNNPVTLGALVTPEHYMEIRKELHEDLRSSKEIIKKEYESYQKIFTKNLEKKIQKDNGLLEYYGPKNPEIILVALGSVVGTIKEVIDDTKNLKIGVLKIKCFRPFPGEEVIGIIKKAKYIAVIDKAINLGNTAGPLAADIKTAAQGKVNNKIQSFVVGLGGRDVTKKIIEKIIKEVKGREGGIRFINN